MLGSGLQGSWAIPQWCCRSSSAQRAKVRSQETPGAGAYDPKLGSVEPSGANSGASMRSKGQRFVPDRSTTDQGVGPGTYEGHVEGSLAASVAKSVERMSRSNPGFGSRQPARELPYQKEQADMPGPGAYESKGKDNRVDGHASSFKSGSQRLQVEDDSGDPGAYDPNGNRDLAHQAMSSFGRSNRAGAGAFGASSARDMKLAIGAARCLFGVLKDNASVTPLDLAGVGRMDFSAAAALRRIVEEIGDYENDVAVKIVNVRQGAARGAAAYLVD